MLSTFWWPFTEESQPPNSSFLQEFNGPFEKLGTLFHSSQTSEEEGGQSSQPPMDSFRCAAMARDLMLSVDLMETTLDENKGLVETGTKELVEVQSFSVWQNIFTQSLSAINMAGNLKHGCFLARVWWGRLWSLVT